MTSSLTACLGKAGTALPSVDRAAILARSRDLRAQGLDAHAAAVQAVQERLDAVNAELKPLSQAMFRKPAKEGGAFEEPQQARAAKQADVRNLIVQHNITAENVMHVKRMGGLAVPSLAITKADHPLENFGEITLLGDRNMATPSKDTKVFGADIYSPRYPQVSYKLTDAQWRRMAEALKPFREEGDGVSRWSVDSSDLLESLVSHKPFQRLVAAETGADPQRIGYHELRGAATEFLRELGAQERLLQGYTYSGNRRYVEHSLDRVVKVLKKELRGGENFNYGAGSLRAKFTPQFRSIEAIRKSRDKLMTAEAFDQVKEEINKELFDLAHDMVPNGGFQASDTAMAIIEDGAKMGLDRAAKEYGIELSPEVKQRAYEFMAKLRNLPTAYFEAKVMRAMDLGEFKAAVIPKDTKPEVRATLESKGLKLYEYETTAERAAVIRRAAEETPDAMFARDAAERRTAPRNAEEAMAQVQARRGASVADVQKIVGEITSGWKNGPQVTVVQHVSQLPGDNPPDVRGLYERGHVWIVAGSREHRTRAGVARTLAHEAIAHYGLRDMLGKDGWYQLMANIRLGVKAGNKALRAIDAYVRSTYVDEAGNLTLTEDQVADEIAARAVEEAIDEDGNFRPGFGFLKAAWAKVAQFLRDLGITVSFSNAELQGMLVQSMRNMEQGERTAGGGRLAVTAAAREEGAMHHRAFHGSPHDFDRFSTEKIGSGEGAQAYGWGLYFAENEGIAGGYRENLSRLNPNRLRVDGSRIDPESMYGRMVEDAKLLGKKAAFQKIDDNIRFNEKYAPDVARMWKSVREQVERTNLDHVEVQRGSVYQVDIPDEVVAKMLLWDKPLGEQPEAVRKALGVADETTASLSGEELYREYVEQFGGQQAASLELDSLGIPGIRYLDEPSRPTGGPRAKAHVDTYNLVVFNDKNVTLTHKDGTPVTKQERADFMEGAQGGDAFDSTQHARSKIVGQTNRQYTPEQQRAMRNVGFETDEPTMADRARALWKDAGKKMAQGIVDQFAPVKDLDKDAYGLLRLSKGASGAFEVLLRGGKLKLTDNVYDFDSTNAGGVVEKLLIPLQGEHHDFFRWIAANRAERLATEGREHLFSAQDIADLKTLAGGTTAFDYTIQTGPGAGTVTRDRTKIYADAQRVFNEFNKNVLDLAEQSGLIDGASRKLWEHEFYVPFYRVMDEADGGIRGANIKGGMVRQQAFKHLKGGKEALNADLLDNTLMNWAHLLDAAAKNRAAKATLEAAERMGIAISAPQHTAQQIASATATKNGIVWFMDGGVQRHFVVDDPYVLTAISALEYAGMRNPVMNAMSTFKHWLTVGVTASPFFKIRNLIRDSVQVIATSPISANPLKNVGQGFSLTKQGTDEYFRLLAGGGTIHFGTMLEGSEAKRVQSLVEAGIDDATILNSDGKVKAFYRKVIEPAITAYNELGNRGEAINRASLYDQLVKQGVSHADASLQARDLMDFSMQGSFTTIRFLTQVVPFMNARLQGLYKLGRAAKEDPARFAAVIGATTLFTLGLWAAYGDDDDWKKREEWDRNGFWWFKFGGKAFRIPKPFEIGAIATLAERGAELFFDKEMTGERFRKQVMAILSDQLSMNPVPQLVKPILDVYANKDSFTGRPIESMGMEKLKPEYRFTDRTSMAARALGTALNVVPGLEGPSPVQIDHLIRGYFGWLGSFVVGAGDVVARPATDQPKHPTPDYWKTATGGMVANLEDAPSRYVSRMYDQAKEIEQAYGTWRSLQKQGKTAEAKEFFADNKDLIAKEPKIAEVKRREARLNEQIRIVERSKLDPDEKLERIRKLQSQKDKVARVAN